MTAPAAPHTTPGESPEHHHVVIVGAGFAGVATAYRLQQAGITDFVVFEKAERAGGTWRDNTYPGCGVDIPSPFYSYSFNPNPDWTRLFASQPEILEHIEQTAEKFGLDRQIRFNTEVLDAAWSAEQRRWLIETTTGSHVAQFAIFATGPITEPQTPQVEGIDDFEGPIFHSARWDHSYDLAGKRVAVVGTGASAIQFVPEIAPKVASLHLLQRTPAWVVPRLNFPVPTPARALFRRVPATQRALRAVIDRIFRGITGALLHERLARALNVIGLAHLRLRVPDKKLRAALTPDFTLGCKRLLVSNAYFPALRRDNVELIPHALARVTKNTIVAADGTEREVDAIILGTGFDLSRPPIVSRVHDESGKPLADRWNTGEGPEAYLSTTFHSVPNAFLLLGPNVLVYSSFVDVIEHQLNYIVDAVATARDQGIEVLSLPEETSRRFNQKLQASLTGTVFNNGGCASYYLDASGRNFATWPWSIGKLYRELSRFDFENYTCVPVREQGAVARRSPQAGSALHGASATAE